MSSGIRTQLYSEQKKFKHKIGYADKLGIPFVIFLGEDEINAGVVAVKDMESGEQVKISLDEAAKSASKTGLASEKPGQSHLRQGIIMRRPNAIACITGWRPPLVEIDFQLNMEGDCL